MAKRFFLNAIGDRNEYLRSTVNCVFSIQQGLANLDPDVDAIYRLLFKTKIVFDVLDPVTISEFSWAPINSQSTWWHLKVHRLMYLPSTCSFRLTDIVRGYVALRIVRSIGHRVSFHSPIVYQERNEHNLIDDLRSEIKLYTHSDSIQQTLDALDLEGLSLSEKLMKCYKALIEISIVDYEEVDTLRTWILDCDALSVID